MSRPSTAGARGVAADTGEKDLGETAKKIVYTYPLVRHSDMSEEMKNETMELVSTACEKHSNNNEAAFRPPSPRRTRRASTRRRTTSVQETSPTLDRARIRRSYARTSKKENTQPGSIVLPTTPETKRRLPSTFAPSSSIAVSNHPSTREQSPVASDNESIADMTRSFNPIVASTPERETEENFRRRLPERLGAPASALPSPIPEKNGQLRPQVPNLFSQELSSEPLRDKKNQTAPLLKERRRHMSTSSARSYKSREHKKTKKEILEEEFNSWAHAINEEFSEIESMELVLE
ncbi:unnamed protein product [Cyprideis torosa]|uniref:Uncharacterized protein n=1 Tax=Cyprideis torosa TaxID=163714 RepID=A0A7R8WAP1_9CRUS|nr:unnamed protein product [Cyprideis torosa]CAG0891264.1 unnamed protein product [Cyprideis torosa]